MGTTLRAELSEKNPYWIEKHRYYIIRQAPHTMQI